MWNIVTPADAKNGKISLHYDTHSILMLFRRNSMYALKQIYPV